MASLETNPGQGGGAAGHGVCVPEAFPSPCLTPPPPPDLSSRLLWLGFLPGKLNMELHIKPQGWKESAPPPSAPVVGLQLGLAGAGRCVGK